MNKIKLTPYKEVINKLNTTTWYESKKEEKNDEPTGFSDKQIFINMMKIYKSKFEIIKPFKKCKRMDIVALLTARSMELYGGDSFYPEMFKINYFVTQGIDVIKNELKFLNNMFSFKVAPNCITIENMCKYNILLINEEYYNLKREYHLIMATKYNLKHSIENKKVIQFIIECDVLHK